MILPGTYALTLALLILGMLATGTWANTFKLVGGKWRFELYYFDFAVGLFAAILIGGFTFGSMGWDGFSVMDDLRLAGKREDLFAFMAGAVFNLGNMLFVAALSIAGMSVAFPVGLGVALIVASLWNSLFHGAGSPLLLTGGCVLVLGAVIADIVAYRSFFLMKLAMAPPPAEKASMTDAGKATAPARATAGKTAPRKVPAKKFRAKGVVLAIFGGLLIGSFYPLLDSSRATGANNGLGPYAVILVFAVGVLFSTFAFNLFFMNLPVQGKPVEMHDYFKGRATAHWAGLLGGILWGGGMMAASVASRAEGVARPNPGMVFALAQGATLLATLWGLVIWKEFAGADGRVKTMLALMLFLLVAGMSLVALAPVVAAA